MLKCQESPSYSYAVVKNLSRERDLLPDGLSSANGDAQKEATKMGCVSNRSQCTCHAQDQPQNRINDCAVFQVDSHVWLSFSLHQHIANESEYDTRSSAKIWSRPHDLRQMRDDRQKYTKQNEHSCATHVFDRRSKSANPDDILNGNLDEFIEGNLKIH